ncbi:hypothetical protein OQA88_4596 [Cercophora sp. LCS_1]
MSFNSTPSSTLAEVDTSPSSTNIGVLLAVCSSLAIGTSYTTLKLGLRGTRTDSHEYLRNPTWWAGMSLHAIGELFNFAAYTFAPAVLVTPLGALSVLTGTVLGAYFLKERLNVVGKMGCALCLVGSVLVVANAPEEREVGSVDEMVALALRPGRNPLFHLSVCAGMGAVSVMALKAFGIAIKLTVEGDNQFTRVSTWLFGLAAAGCIVVQMNYFNKALSVFPQSIVSPIYYVTFTTAVLTASFILFQGFNITDGVKSVSLFAGFLTIFTGVYLLNFNGSDLDEGLSDANSEHELGSIRSLGTSASMSEQSFELRRSADTLAPRGSAVWSRRRA